MHQIQPFLKRIALAIIVPLTFLYNLSLPAQRFSKEEVLSDLEELMTSLEATHFNLYAYTSKQAFKAHYLQIQNQIVKDSFSMLETTTLFQQLVAKAHNAHTRISFPAQAYRDYAESGGRIIPLEIAIENGNALIRKNWSDETTIPIGAELKSINGMPITAVLERIYLQIPAERLYFAQAQLEGFSLPRYYWQVFGGENTYEVEVEHNGQLETHDLKGIRVLEDYEFKRDDILQKDRRFRFLSESVAYLRPGELGGDEARYRAFIDSAFIQTKIRKAKTLLIDLRNNPGGDDSFGDYMVSYIADQPFKWASKFQLKSSALVKENVRQTKDTTKAYWNSFLTHTDGTIYPFDFGYYELQPKGKRFTGKVYVLVNRQSYSQATVTAAQIQDYGFGEIVGEETAEYPNLFASIFTYSLPNTGIAVDVSKGKIERVSGIDTGQGVLPDIEIKDHLLEGKDEILDGLMQIITRE